MTAASTSYGCVFSIASTALQQNASALASHGCDTCLDSGTRIVHANRQWPQPSRRAASRSSPGNVRKNWRIRNVPKPVATKGTISPGYALIQPSSATSRYLGMISDSTGIIIVAMNAANAVRRNGKSMNTNA